MELEKKLYSYSEKKYKNFLNTSPLESLHVLKLHLDDVYYNTGDSIFPDERYDMLKETLEKRDPGYVPPIGAKIRVHDNRAKLDYHMGSADKITEKDANVLERWTLKNDCRSYCVTEKLDGVSGLFVFKKGKRGKKGSKKLYTRGDGEIGADISFFIQYLKSIPKYIETDIVVRGELIIKKKKFTEYNEKYKDKTTEKTRVYKNARNMVSGLIGAKTLRQGITYVDFVSYEIVGSGVMSKPEDQLKELKNLGFKIVKRSILKDLSIPKLTKTHELFKSKSTYEIDGIIVQSNIEYDRNTSGNPEYLFAYKVRSVDNIATTIVRDMKWSITKWGHITPVAITDPVTLSGATLSRFSCHNAGNVMENGIGIGSKVVVTRSNDVIPFILEVLEKSEDMNLPEYEYSWDDNKVNFIISKGQGKDIMTVKMISSFFEKLGIKHISEATVQKLYDHGFDTLFKIVGASVDELIEVEGIQKKGAERIMKNIKEGLKDVSMPVILGAYGVFGFGVGRKRVEALFTDIPELLQIEDEKDAYNRILAVEGFSEIMTEKVVENLGEARKFLEGIEKYVTFKKNTRVSDSLVGQKFVFSGFRDNDLEQKIVDRGGKVVSSVSKKTSGIVVKDSKQNSGKIKKARELGVEVYERDEFIKKFCT